MLRRNPWKPSISYCENTWGPTHTRSLQWCIHSQITLTSSNLDLNTCNRLSKVPTCQHQGLLKRNNVQESPSRLPSTDNRESIQYPIKWVPPRRLQMDFCHKQSTSSLFRRRNGLSQPGLYPECRQDCVHGNNTVETSPSFIKISPAL